jgi:hypothetical protein
MCQKCKSGFHKFPAGGQEIKRFISTVCVCVKMLLHEDPLLGNG